MNEIILRIAQKREAAVSIDVNSTLADKKLQKKDKDERFVVLIVILDQIRYLDYGELFLTLFFQI